MKIKIALCFLFLSTLLMGNEEINKDWLKIDESILKTVLPVLKGNIETNKIIDYLMYPYDSSNDKKIGFNYKINNFIKPGGYSKSKLSIVINEKINIIFGEIQFICDEYTFEILNKKFDLESIKTIKLNNCGFKYCFKNEMYYQIYCDAITKNIGKANMIEIPVSISREYELLTNPISDITFGSLCGIAARKPEARIAFEKIIKNGNITIIENILISTNSEGRMYALEYLFYNDKDIFETNNKYSFIIKNIFELKIQVKLCSLCINFEHQLINKNDFIEILKQI